MRDPRKVGLTAGAGISPSSETATTGYDRLPPGTAVWYVVVSDATTASMDNEADNLARHNGSGNELRVCFRLPARLDSASVSSWFPRTGS